MHIHSRPARKISHVCMSVCLSVSTSQGQHPVVCIQNPCRSVCMSLCMSGCLNKPLQTSSSMHAKSVCSRTLPCAMHINKPITHTAVLFFQYPAVHIRNLLVQERLPKRRGRIAAAGHVGQLGRRQQLQVLIYERIWCWLMIGVDQLGG